MTPQTDAAIQHFERIILAGVPYLLKQNETAFLSFMCDVAALDALAAYRFPGNDVGPRFKAFITEYFPPAYGCLSDNLYLFRCRLLHNFSPAYFTLVHGNPTLHLTISDIGDTILSDQVFFADLSAAATKFFAEVRSDISRQAIMDARLSDVTWGGAIYIK
jgi:hypothetical protein